MATDVTRISAVGLQRAREQFLSAGALNTDAVAPRVLDSWRRSRDLRVHPDRVDLPYVREPNTDSPLVRAAAPVLRRIASDLSSQAVSVILTSADGLVLERVTSDPAMLKALDDVRLARGYSYAEEFAGTNGIGTTLETGAATFIQGNEHYVGTLGRLACAGSPIRDPITGKLLGVVDLTCWANLSDPLLFVLAKSAGSQIEDRISAFRTESETALLEAYLKQNRRYPGGVLAIGGDVVLMNPHLRQTLDANDQRTLLDHASDMCHATAASTVVATLPSGMAAKITTADRMTTGSRGSNVVFHVHLSPESAAVGGTGCDTSPVDTHPCGTQQFLAPQLPAGGAMLPGRRLGGAGRREWIRAGQTRAGGRTARGSRACRAGVACARLRDRRGSRRRARIHYGRRGFRGGHRQCGQLDR